MTDYKNTPLKKLFAYEIAQIDDIELQNVVKRALDEVQPCHAWKPASSTGKYHPEYASGEGGLVRHTKVVVRVVIDFVRATPEVTQLESQFIAAAILHDMWKYAEGEAQEFTSFDHPHLGKEYCYRLGEIEPYKNDPELVSKLTNIGDLIAAHQGRWTTHKSMPKFENQRPHTFPQYILHYADYVASRAYLNASFDEEGDLILDTFSQRNENKPQRRIIK